MENILPIITLAIGWLLSELSHYRRNRAKDIQVTNRALSDLLEIWHIFYVTRFLTKHIAQELKFDKETSEVFSHITHSILSKGLHDPGALKKRYEDSLSLLASSNPVLAFRLRAKESINASLDEAQTQLQNILSIETMASEVLKRFQTIHTNVILEDLEELILELARSNSFSMYLNLKKILLMLRSPEKFTKLLREYKNKRITSA